MLLPKKSVYISSEVSLFDTLVSVGEERSLVTLSYELHFFLVSCLVEHLYDIALPHQVVSLALLSATERYGARGSVLLKRAGDGALLIAGLYPERALRLRVSSSYFRFMGESAYTSLSAKQHVIGNSGQGELYNTVASNLVLLIRVLGGSRARPTSQWAAYQRFRAGIA